MAITNAIMQVRRGLEADFDPEKMHPGEWSLSTDTKYIRMCIDPGTCLRMATYEAFEEDMERIEVIYADFKDAELDIVAAENSANLSESYAIGGTGTREGEDTDNAKYYSQKAKESADKLDTMTVDVLTKQLGEWEKFEATGANNPICGCYGNGMYVLGCQNATIMYSLDGENWLEANYSYTMTPVAMIHNGKYFVAISDKGNILWSSNGIDWYYYSNCGLTSATSMCFVPEMNMFVIVGAVGTVGSVVYASDVFGEYTVVSITDSKKLYSLAYGNGTFVAVDMGSRKAYYSYDAITWTLADFPDANYWPYGVTYCNGMFTIVGSSGTTWISNDGISWKRMVNALSAYSSSVANGNGLIIRTDYTGYVLLSKDAITWEKVKVLNTTVSFQNVFYVNGKFFVSDTPTYNTSSGGSAAYCLDYAKETINISESIKDLYSKANRMPYALVPILSTKWTASTEYTGYGYEFVQAIEDYYDTFPEWFLKPLSGIVPTEAEQTAFETIAAMRLDISDTSSPKLKFYAATQPTTDILVLVKGVQ